MVHVHSTYSFDGDLTLRELHAIAHREGLRFICLTEHIEGLDHSTLEGLIRDCQLISDEHCVLVPGIEIEDLCQYFIGLSAPIRVDTPSLARDDLLAQGAMAVLAHPHRLKRPLTPEEVEYLAAVEIWNLKDDGEFAPGYVGLKTWEDWSRKSVGKPFPIVGMDLHSRRRTYPLTVSLEIEQVASSEIVAALMRGEYQICSAGSVMDPSSVRIADRALGYAVWRLRRLYRSLGLRRFLPPVVRESLKRAFKG